MKTVTFSIQNTPKNLAWAENCLIVFSVKDGTIEFQYLLCRILELPESIYPLTVSS